MSETTRGIHHKFDVKRTDGSSEKGGKHEGCAYYVLDLEHDEFAVPALKAYAKACRKRYPALAADIDSIIANKRTTCSCREASCPHLLAQSFQGESVKAHELMHDDALKEANRRAREDLRQMLAHDGPSFLERHRGDK